MSVSRVALHDINSEKQVVCLENSAKNIIALKDGKNKIVEKRT